LSFLIRPAERSEDGLLCGLVARSLQQLGAGYYTEKQVQGALTGACSVDTQLIDDGTYFVAVTAEGRIVGCGGWSFRQTLFGGDNRPGRNPERLDPAIDAAKIRAFFVDPAFARQGIGRALLAHCEAEAIAHGFRRFELMSTLPGVPLYRRYGYVPDAMIHYPVGTGTTIEFVPMSKDAVIL
jgi:GNAT superfamily N-acetyltransferase